ncbi:MAG: putative ABC transporter permease [Eubacteriales bacterium]|nr:putative ABC transporter permease [Eubacteriales bacterium]
MIEDFISNGIYNIGWWFWAYSFLGWAFECIYVMIHEGRAINRGFVIGPFCTIYGVGALLILFILDFFSGSLPVLFIMAVVITSALEYIVYIILDKIFHQQWWDYSDLRFHYKGILSLESSIAWGVLSVLLYKLIHPLVQLGIRMIPHGIGKKLLIGITVLYVLDFLWACLKAIRRSESSRLIILRVKTETIRRILLSLFKRKTK